MSEPTPLTVAQEPSRRRWWLIFGGSTFWISILIHVLFVAAAAYIVVQHFSKKHVNFVATPPPAAQDDVEHKVELARRNNVESAPPDLKRITTTDLSAISLPDVPETPATDEPTPTTLAGTGDVGEGLGGGNGNGGGDGSGNPFGDLDSTMGLKGYFYDLKQRSDRKPSALTSAGYFKTLANFALVSNWDESLLAKYFKSPKALSTVSIMIPFRDSIEGPKAFRLEDVVQPGGWIIVYKATVQAPVEGNYRFAGFSDNQMYVQIDGATVLDTGTEPPAPQFQEKEKYLPNEWFSLGTVRRWPAHYGEVRVGPAFHVDSGREIDMKVLIGDAPGGKENETCHFLFLMKEGETYEQGPGGEPKLPLFRLSNTDVQPEGQHPPFTTTDYATWSAKPN